MATETTNKPTRSRFEICLAKLEEVLDRLDRLEKSEREAREELYVHVNQLLSEQREELIRLKNEISTECRLENIRRLRAKRQFLSE